MEKNFKWQSRILYPAKVYFNHEGEINSLSDIQKLKVFITSWLTPQEILTEVLWANKNDTKLKPRSTQKNESKVDEFMFSY